MTIHSPTDAPRQAVSPKTPNISVEKAEDLSHDALAKALTETWTAEPGRYVDLWGKWLFWDSTRWAPDGTLKHMTRTRDYLLALGNAIVDDVVANPNQDPKKQRGRLRAALATRAMLRKKEMITAVVSLARSNHGIAADVDLWDADPWLLGTPGGTVDLRTGELRMARPGDYITKQTAVTPAAIGTAPVLWLKFLDRITAGDKDLQLYLQRWFGYALTGDTGEHVFGFGYGEGANGKGVSLETLKRVMGDYASTIGTEMLMVSHNDRHPTELARLRGIRLALGSETEEGKIFAEAIIKKMTGGDTIHGRFMRQDFFEFIPQFKLFIIGNHKPVLRTVDEAMRRRLHLVPFDVTIPKAERDKELVTKLEAEWPAILRWAIDGCLEWQKQGLNPPECVLAATADYLSSADTFEAWRSECTKNDRTAWTSNASLWTSWEGWCEDNGEFVGKPRTFSDRLVRAGFKPLKQTGRGYQGLSLNPLWRTANSDTPATPTYASVKGRSW